MIAPMTHAQRIARSIMEYEQYANPRFPGKVAVSQVGYGTILDELRKNHEFHADSIGRLDDLPFENPYPLILFGWMIVDDAELRTFDYRIIPR